MPSIGWTLRGKQRILELSLGGRWYLAFTMAVGVAAVYSGNNVIYLLESLLLSSLLVSGILSEFAISRVRVSRELGNLHVGMPGNDAFIVENLGKIPLYCLELGEYLGDECFFSAFLLAVPGRTTVRVASNPTLSQRGRHRWDGMVVATSFPFGFARKIRFISGGGTRIVWPALLDPGAYRQRLMPDKRGELDWVAGEVEPVQPWQDASRVHWPISARTGELMARPHHHAEPNEEVWLDLMSPSPEMEKKISRAAGAVVRKARSLILVQKGERRRIEGTSRALDALALLPKEPS